VDQVLGKRIIALRQRVVANFAAEQWQEVGLLTGLSEMVNKYPRLLRSLHWNDEDYSGNVLGLLTAIAERHPKAFRLIEEFVEERWPGDSEYVSAKPADRRITFAPHVFRVPELSVEPDLVAVMMPFGKEFDPVYQAIKPACRAAGLRCLRADDIWEESTIIQDIFNLVFRAQVVLVDFTGKNPNVMYETGIAHTLGKDVLPISQSLSDVPFDMTHHRVLKYLPNREGLSKLTNALTKRLEQMGVTGGGPAGSSAPQEVDDDDVPF